MIGYTGSWMTGRTIKKPDGKEIRVGQILTEATKAIYPLSNVQPDSSDNRPVEVWKLEEEISKDAFLASIEGAPITLNHPMGFVTSENWSDKARGHVQNVRLGPRTETGNLTVIGDLHLEDQALIDRVHSGTKGISLGYTYTLGPGPTPTSFSQRDMRCNHVSIVASPRMESAVIMDSNSDSEEEIMNTQQLSKLCDLLEKLLVLCSGRAAGETSEDDANTGDLDVDRIQGNGADAGAARACYDHLRSMRGLIEASGDVSTVLAFNDAMRAVKAQLRSAPIQRSSAMAFDAPPSTSSGEFENAVRDLREKMLHGENDSSRASSFYRPQRFCRQPAMDYGQPQPETFEEMMARVRAKMLAAK